HPVCLYLRPLSRSLHLAGLSLGSGHRWTHCLWHYPKRGDSAVGVSRSSGSGRSFAKRISVIMCKPSSFNKTPKAKSASRCMFKAMKRGVWALGIFWLIFAEGVQASHYSRTFLDTYSLDHTNRDFITSTALVDTNNTSPKLNSIIQLARANEFGELGPVRI